ncbi:MAG: S-methyl-5'-thioinosine phosphorylase [Gammaproteobacteria bacterium]
MTAFAVIGGTGVPALNGLNILRQQVCQTPFGEPSGPFAIGELYGKELIFLARHGPGHTIPPHRINYRANIWALKQLGAPRIIAIAAVGGIAAEMWPSRLAFPHQIIDYTASRAHTFFEDTDVAAIHIDFTEPYSAELRTLLIQGAADAGLDACDHGIYGATQGPRLETAAEIDRLERDGCTMVGMTGMPEAALARELELAYASCAVVTNWAAGRSDGPLTIATLEANLKSGMQQVNRLLRAVIARL